MEQARHLGDTVFSRCVCVWPVNETICGVAARLDVRYYRTRTDHAVATITPQSRVLGAAAINYHQQQRATLQHGAPHVSYSTRCGRAWRDQLSDKCDCAQK